MPNADPTTTPFDEQPQRSDHRAIEWALVANDHLNRALDEFLSTLDRAALPDEVRDALLRLTVSVAKLLGVLEWLGEGLVVLPEASSE